MGVCERLEIPRDFEAPELHSSLIILFSSSWFFSGKEGVMAVRGQAETLIKMKKKIIKKYKK